jgi:hypothetical protein
MTLSISSRKGRSRIVTYTDQSVEYATAGRILQHYAVNVGYILRLGQSTWREEGRIRQAVIVLLDPRERSPICT